MKTKMLLFKLTAFMLIAVSCKKDPETNNESVTKNVVKGKVVDTKGQPIKGVSILIDNTLIYNSYLSGTTGDDGTYQISLVNGAWQAYAEMNVAYNGKTYKIDLHPDNADGFSQEGAVRNFQWKLTGQKPTPLTGFYGGTILVDKSLYSAIADPENIEFTLTPVGVLIDGSNGQVIKMKPGQPLSDTYGKLRDLPIGRYTITAVYQSSSGNVPLKLRDKLNYGSGFTSSVQIDFQPTSSIGNNMAVIEFNEN